MSLITNSATAKSRCFPKGKLEKVKAKCHLLESQCGGPLLPLPDYTKLTAGYKYRNGSENTLNVVQYERIFSNAKKTLQNLGRFISLVILQNHWYQHT